MIRSWPFPSTIPTPRLSSFNIRGLSAYHINKTTKDRHLKIINIINNLTQKSDIILLQETHLNPNEKYELQHNFPHWKVYYNNKSSNSAGTAMLIAPKLHKNLDIEHHIHQTGSNHSLIFKDSHSTHPSFQVFNIYLPSGNNWQEKIDQIGILNEIPPQSYSFFAGDWNFVESLEDTVSSSQYYQQTKKFNSIWEQFKNKFSLQEVSQPYLTRISKSHSGQTFPTQHETRSLPISVSLGQKITAARLDRLYISYDLAEISIANPTLSIHNTYLHKAPPSDHIPITLSYKLGKRKTRRQYQIPEWVLSNKKFKEKFKTYWHQNYSPKSPYTDILFFQNSLKKHAKDYCKFTTNQDNTPLHKLNTAIALSRECSKIEFSPKKIREILLRSQILRKQVTLNIITEKYNTTKLKIYIKKLYIKYGTPNDSSSKTKINKLKKLKILLPKDKKSLSFLHDPATEERNPTPNQDKWPEIAKKYWGDKIWAAPTDDPEDIHLILKGYSHPDLDERNNRPYHIKKTKYSFPDHRYQYPMDRRFRHFPDPPSLIDITKTIRESPSSAPGPDGIPFKVYRAFLEISSTLIKNILDEICSGRPPPSDFNLSNLYLIPKKLTHKIEDTRPISVPTTLNRIISTTIKNKVMFTFSEFLLPNQYGFISGRTIKKNIYQNNKLLL